MNITSILSSPLVYDTLQYIACGGRSAPLFLNDNFLRVVRTILHDMFRLPYTVIITECST